MERGTVVIGARRRGRGAAARICGARQRAVVAGIGVVEGGGRVGTGWVVLVAVGDRCRAALGDRAVVGQVGRRSDVGDRDGERGAAGVAVLVRDVRGDRVCPVVVVGVGAEAEIALTRRAERVAGRAVTPVDLDVPRAVVVSGSV